MKASTGAEGTARGARAGWTRARSIRPRALGVRVSRRAAAACGVAARGVVSMSVTPGPRPAARVTGPESAGPWWRPVTSRFAAQRGRGGRACLPLFSSFRFVRLRPPRPPARPRGRRRRARRSVCGCPACGRRAPLETPRARSRRPGAGHWRLSGSTLSLRGFRLSISSPLSVSAGGSSSP